MKKRANNQEETLLSVYDKDVMRLSVRVGIDRSPNTLKVLMQGRKYAASFLNEEMGISDILLKKLTPQLIHDFSNWLSTVRHLRGGTVWLACQQLKGVVTRAHQRGLIKWNPFAGFRIAKNIRPREYLTEEELAKLASFEFKNKRLAFARDLFIFSAFTGMTFIDIKELRPSDIVSFNGADWIISKRHKTKVPYMVKLLNIPSEIIMRNKQQGVLLFGPMEYRTMAKRLEKVMSTAGITKKATFHCARHSFAILALNKGMPIESLSRILGHTNIKTTQIYAKITMKKIDEDMNLLAQQIFF